MPTANIRSVLAASDLSPLSDAVVRQAGLLAARANAELHLVHVVEPLEPEAVGDRAPETIRSRSAELDEQAKRCLPPELTAVHSKVVGGTPDLAVLRHVADAPADVLVMGPHRGGRLDARFLGTTAERVLREVNAPCLVVRDEIPLPLRRIGAPIDLSDPAQNALEVALAWADIFQDDTDSESVPEAVVRVLHVGWSVDVASDPEMETREVRPKLEQQIRAALENSVGTEGVTVDAKVVWANQPAESIRIWSRRENIDLLVTGTHGRSGVKRAILGSVAIELAQTAPCSVLVVPPGFRSESLFR